MSDEEKSASDEEEATTQTLASSRTRRDNAGKRFVHFSICDLDFIPYYWSLGSRMLASLRLSRSSRRRERRGEK